MQSYTIVYYLRSISKNLRWKDENERLQVQRIYHLLAFGNYATQNNFINNTVTRLWRVLAYFVEVIFWLKR